MTTATEPTPSAGAVLSDAVRSVVAWCRREVVTVVLALVVAAFLWQSGFLTVPLYVAETDTYLNLPGQGVLSPFSIAAAMSVVLGVFLTRRSALLGTGLTLLPFLVAPWWGTFVWGWLLGTIAVATVAATRSWRRAVLPYVAAVTIAAFYCISYVPAVLPIGVVTAGTSPGNRRVTLIIYVVAITAVVAISASISALERARRQVASALVKETNALHVELVAGERAQVARDLHDVVAHHVSLIAVRAESAPYQHPDLGDEARAVLAEIAEDARQALGELRQVLVVLQRAEGSIDGQPGRAPQPEAADIDELVLSAQTAGQQVEVRGGWGAVPSAQGYVLYRAVQEGLTNARRHAPRSAVVLTRTRAGSTIGFTMTNPAKGTAAVEPGRGIVGMRERVESLGGSMSAATGADGFELAVTLPVDAADDRAEVDA